MISYSNTAPIIKTKPLAPKLIPVQQTECIQCGLCEPVCPKNLQPHALNWQRNSSDAMTHLNLDHCIECMLCDKICPSHIPLTNNFIVTKARITQETVEAEQALAAEARYEKRSKRLSQAKTKLRTRANSQSRTDLLASLKVQK